MFSKDFEAADSYLGGDFEAADSSLAVDFK
jgi:hypothetical protein